MTEREAPGASSFSDHPSRLGSGQQRRPDVGFQMRILTPGPRESSLAKETPASTGGLGQLGLDTLLLQVLVGIQAKGGYCFCKRGTRMWTFHHPEMSTSPHTARWTRPPPLAVAKFRGHVLKLAMTGLLILHPSNMETGL